MKHIIEILNWILPVALVLLAAFLLGDTFALGWTSGTIGVIWLLSRIFN